VGCFLFLWFFWFLRPPLFQKCISFFRGVLLYAVGTLGAVCCRFFFLRLGADPYGLVQAHSFGGGCFCAGLVLVICFLSSDGARVCLCLLFFNNPIFVFNLISGFLLSYLSLLWSRLLHCFLGSVGPAELVLFSGLVCGYLECYLFLVVVCSFVAVVLFMFFC